MSIPEKRSHHTPGPWAVHIDDTGGEWSGWPLGIDAVNDEDKTIVRPGGFYPYEWCAAVSQREAVANARLIAQAWTIPQLRAALEGLLSDVTGLMADFDGLTDDPYNIGRFHDWSWLKENGRLDGVQKAIAALALANEPADGGG